MISVFLDIETICAQGNARQAFIDSAIANYKPPSTLTKTAACLDLGVSVSAAKGISKDEAIQQWVERFGPAAAEAVGDAEWRKTSLDGGQGEVISIAWAVGDGEIGSVSRDYKDASSEPPMINAFFNRLITGLTHPQIISRDATTGREDVVRQRHTDKPYFIGHNIPFDLKFLFRRAVILGIKPPFELPFNGWHGKDYYDNMYAWCGKGDRISQDNLCKALGLEGKPDGIDGSRVWDEVKAGNISRVVEYNKSDVHAVRSVYNRLTFNE